MKPAFWIPDCPMGVLHTLSPRPKAPWFEALKEDIKARGIISPLIVREGKVHVGNNRYMAARDLRIETVPVIWQGSGWHGEPITFEEAKALIKDGNLVMCNLGWLRLNGAKPPQSMEYPDG